MPKDICPTCGNEKDKRSVHCGKCVVHVRPKDGQVRKLEKLGYLYIMVDGKGVYEHRYIMEKHLGRKLMRSEHVHHINGDKTDNRLCNLELLDGSNHHKRHLNSEKAKSMSLLGHAARWGGQNSNI